MKRNSGTISAFMHNAPTRETHLAEGRTANGGLRREFNSLKSYIALYDGMGKPRINFQEMYTLFPEFTFTASRDFGTYDNFNEAYERKNYCMIVESETGGKAYLTYYEYQDAPENTAYLS